MAFKKTEVALGFIHMYSPGAFFAKSTTYCLPKGIMHINTETSFTVENGGMTNHNEKRLAYPKFVAVDSGFVNGFPNEALTNYNTLMVSDSLTTFAEKVLNSILLYSKATTSTDLSDKIIYTFSALESVLLRNDSESITQNLSERMAFFI